METLIVGTDLFLDIELFEGYVLVWFYADDRLTWSFGTRNAFDIQFFTDRNLGNLINV